jgi:small nuclear ribonucleoprotein (snRNP)-like protein
VTISELKPFQDAEVTLQLKDGEVLRAKIAFVDVEYEDIVVDVIETTRPENYKNSESAYSVAASDVLSVTQN